MLFMLPLPILLCNIQNIAEYEAYWLMGFPMINLWGAHFASKFSVFSVMAGWIAEILFMLLFACVYFVLCLDLYFCIPICIGYTYKKWKMLM